MTDKHFSLFTINNSLIGLIIITLIIINHKEGFSQDLKRLNGYKTIVVPILEYKDNSTDNWHVSRRVVDFFEKKGFNVLAKSNQSEQKNCDYLYCNIEHIPSIKNTVNITIVDCNETLIYLGKGQYGNQRGSGEFARYATNMALDGLLNFKYEYDQSLIIENNQTERISITEDSLKTYLDKGITKPIEGIYKTLNQEGGNYYKVGIIQSANLFKMFILDTDNNQWKKGDLKAIFEETAIKDIYSIKLFNTWKNSQETFGTLTKNGLITVDVFDQFSKQTIQRKYIKTFPNLNQFSSSESNNWSSQGSGFLISSKGLIATNAHVVQNSKKIKAFFFKNNKQKECNAEVIIKDYENDIAIIQITDTNFRISESLPYEFNLNGKVGEDVFTIGYPKITLMGENSKLTNGIISSSLGYQNDPKYFQVSVPFQPGNSGGPLFDKNGNIIGITSAKLISNEFENVGYALKIDYLNILLKNVPNFSPLKSNNLLTGKDLEELYKILDKYTCLIKVE